MWMMNENFLDWFDWSFTLYCIVLYCMIIDWWNEWYIHVLCICYMRDVLWMYYSSVNVLEFICLKNGRLQLPEDCHPAIREIVLSCWETDPDNRPSFDHLCNKLSTLVDEVSKSQPYPWYNHWDRINCCCYCCGLIWLCAMMNEWYLLHYTYTSTPFTFTKYPTTQHNSDLDCCVWFLDACTLPFFLFPTPFHTTPFHTIHSFCSHSIENCNLSKIEQLIHPISIWKRHPISCQLRPKNYLNNPLHSLPAPLLHHLQQIP